MRLHVMLLDRDPRVSGLATRPLELRWHGPSGVRSHAPQLMLRLVDGQGVLADCTGKGELSRRQRSVAAVVGEICTAVGWRYWVLEPVDPIYRRNVTWLAGYRHPRHHGGQLLAAALQEAFAEPAPLLPSSATFNRLVHALAGGRGLLVSARQRRWRSARRRSRRVRRPLDPVALTADRGKRSVADGSRAACPTRRRARATPAALMRRQP